MLPGFTASSSVYRGRNTYCEYNAARHTGATGPVGTGLSANSLPVVPALCLTEFPSGKTVCTEPIPGVGGELCASVAYGGRFPALTLRWCGDGYACQGGDCVCTSTSSCACGEAMDGATCTPSNPICCQETSYAPKCCPKGSNCCPVANSTVIQCCPQDDADCMCAR